MKFKSEEDKYLFAACVLIVLICIAAVMSSTHYCNFRINNAIQACNDYYQPKLIQCQYDKFSYNVSQVGEDE